MHNKKIIAKGLTYAVLLSNIPMNSLANSIKEYETIKENKEFINSKNNANTSKKRHKTINPVKVNKNIVKNSVREIVVPYGEYVPNLSGNPGGYETIRVITEGGKKLVKQDYDNLRLSGIPKIDLSDAQSDSIPEGAFTNATHLTEFKFPQGITSISQTSKVSYYEGAFSGCKNLSGELIIPSTVRIIGDEAFRGCSSLTGSLVIPDSVTAVEYAAFEGCSGFNGTLTLGKSLKKLDEYSFRNCRGFTGDLVIPDSVTTLKHNVFENCSGFNGKLTLSNALTTIGAYAFNGCSGFIGELILPESMSDISIATFDGCSGFTGSLIIPNSVTTIRNFAFDGCSGFDKVVLPNTLRDIGNYVFRGCTGFTGDLVIPNSVTTIGDSSFKNCTGFNSGLVIGNSVVSIGVSSFEGCNGFTGKLTIPDTVISIGEYAFNGCDGFNDTLTLGNSLETIGQYAFKGCSRIKGPLLIPDTLTSASNAFSGCSSILKIIVKLNETYKDSNYRETIIKQLPISKTYVEMSYNFDTTNTWLNSTTYKKARPTISTYVGDFENNEGIGVSLNIIEASPIKTITILKDGLDYNLEKSENGKYIFNESGNYQIYIETELGTISNIEFKNISPINIPGINIIDNNLNIVNNGIMSDEPLEDENSSEDFNDVNNLKYNFSNSNWIIENGILKSEAIGDYEITENEFKVNANLGEKIQIRVKTSSESNCDYGCIYINGKRVYRRSGTLLASFQVLEFDLQEGENIIKFVYEKDSSDSSGDDAMSIDYIKILVEGFKSIPCDTLEYRIDGGDWQVYTGSFNLEYPIGTKIQIEVRAKHDGYVSEIFSQEVVIEFSTKSIEDAIEKAEQSKELVDISNARDLVNQMPESSNKDIFQDRLDAIFADITLEKQNITASSDIYIKFKSTLSLSLDTSVVTFEDYSGFSDLEMLGAVNLTVSSSSPYQINAYMTTEIANADGSKKMPIEILNIKEGNEANYQTFRSITDKVVLKDNCVEGDNNVHSIDLKLASNQVHKADVYKTAIRFEAEQK